jgi:hypothetical protein
MPRVVWKFPLDVTKITQLTIPPAYMDTPVRMAGLDPADGGPAIWIEFDQSHPRLPRYFRIHGTGEPVENGEVHVGSMIDRSFVWHVYEVVQ